ncbi:hypothetical protein DZ765_09905 [Enterococcus faecium]|nr:hypothetical protein [Enterococcus faecium]
MNFSLFPKELLLLPPFTHVQSVRQKFFFTFVPHSLRNQLADFSPANSAAFSLSSFNNLLS